MGVFHDDSRTQRMIVLVPYPARSHVTSMLKLAVAFSNFGFTSVLITPEFIHRNLLASTSLGGSEAEHTRIRFMPLPEETENNIPSDFFGIEDMIENSIPFHLERILRQLNEHNRVLCLVVDLLVSSAFKVANSCDVPVAGFWPAMLATYRLITAIPDMVCAGFISDAGSPLHRDPVFTQPKQPVITPEHLPWLIGTPVAREGRFRFWRRVVSRSKCLLWLIVNSFPVEEGTPGNSSSPNVVMVGALTKEATLTRVPQFSAEDKTYMQWLDVQTPSSVIYISFGSWVIPADDGMVRNLAVALEEIGKPFIWALGSTWRKELPDGFINRVSEFGKVVFWAAQLEILQHSAVGCFFTHCGWNSTMEAIQCKRRLLCYPLAGDQFLNCAYIVDEWKVGVRIKPGFGKKELEESWKKLIEDEQMDQRLKKLREKLAGFDASFMAMTDLTACVDAVGRAKEHNDS